MKNYQFFKPNLVAVAVALAFPYAAYADEVAELISPDVSEVVVKLQNVSKVNPLYREYSGMNHQGANGSLDADVVRRSEGGRWLKVEGRDLGLGTQELKVGVEQQGDWGVGLEYNQIPHYGPYQVHTEVQGIGGTHLNLPATFGGLTEKTLKTERTATSLTARKFFSEHMMVHFSFKNEDKKGARLMGANGVTGPGVTGMLFSPEPIDSNHQQVEAALEYHTKKFQVSAGYYGSFFSNNAGNALFANYGTNGLAGGALQRSTPTAMSPLSLAPDNHAQEIYLSGGYNWTDDTRGNLKISKTFAVQDDDFISNSSLGSAASLSGRSNLGGKVDTTHVFASVTSRLTKQLDVLASWTYEDQDDKTPRAVYLQDVAHGGAFRTNNPESETTNRGRLEATYRMPLGYAVTAGYDYQQRKTPDLAERYREKVQESTYRLDLRKPLSETLNGSIRLAHSKRDGSDWNTVPTPSSSAVGPTPAQTPLGEFWVAPTQFADRDRNKLRLMLDWLPLQALSVQFAYEYNHDDYSTRVGNVGLTSGRADLYSIDVTYQLTENWKSSLWYSYSTNDTSQGSRQSQQGNPCSGTAAATTCIPWEANLKLSASSAGLGVNGKVNGRLDVGAKAFYTHDVNRYDIDVTPGTSSLAATGAGILPDTVYTQKSVHLFGKYAVSKATAIRLDYIWDRREMDDYTWSGWTYSDGTRVTVEPNQTTHILGLSVIQAF
jgi:MtrB/PioB family decaheme-associated outer membrane protein